MQGDFGAVVDKLAAVRRRIDQVERSFTHHVEVLAVTKGLHADAIRAAVEGGCTAVGENYAQDLLSKREIIEGLQPEVHFIGRLQSNKVRQICDLVSVWESLDRESIVSEVAKRAPHARVLIQVNATGESGKGGCALGEVAALVEDARRHDLNVEGLMTVGPTNTTAEDARPGFAVVRALVDDLGLSTCSMGMTADLEVAVAEGATQIRVGSALFGPRPGH